MEEKDTLSPEQEERLKKLVRKAETTMMETISFCDDIQADRQHHRYRESMRQASILSGLCAENLKNMAMEYRAVRDALELYYFPLLNTLKEIFDRILDSSETDYLTMDMWNQRNKITLLYSDYVLLNQNYRQMRDAISENLISAYKSSYMLVVDEQSPLFDTTDMKYLEFFSDINLIRIISKNIVSDVNISKPGFSSTILEGQVSEIIKNSVRHGNRNDLRKKVKIWYMVTDRLFRIIVEDEGSGFKNFDEWNEFNKKRNEALRKGRFEEMLKYVQYKGPESTEEDGGNSLFAALEYWDSSLVYNRKKNKVAAVKYLI